MLVVCVGIAGGGVGPSYSKRPMYEWMDVPGVENEEWNAVCGIKGGSIGGGCNWYWYCNRIEACTIGRSV
jgi:hypothetical protein